MGPYDTRQEGSGGRCVSACHSVCVSVYTVYICVRLPPLVAMCPGLGDSQGEHDCMWLWDCMISSDVCVRLCSTLSVLMKLFDHVFLFYVQLCALSV